MRFEVKTNSEAYGDEVASTKLKQELVRQFPTLRTVERTRFVMFAAFADLIVGRRKRTTIRYAPHAVEYPAKSTLPLFVVARGDRHEDAVRRGELRIRGICYKTMSELDDHDAEEDGFRNKKQLLDALQEFYGRLAPSDLVCIYQLEPVKIKSNSKRDRSVDADHRRGAVSDRSQRVEAI